MMEDRQEPTLGDMPPEEFRQYGHRLVDWVADYLENLDRYPVLAQVEPGEIKDRLPAEAPESGESMEEMLADLESVIMPGVTHWNHPAFFSYFAITGSGPGILGELVSAALNLNGMLWKTSPSVTELEERTLSWLRRWLGLPEEFWGVIYDTASVSTFHALAAARQLLPGDVRREGLMLKEGLRPRAYASEQAHSSVEKAAIALGIGQEGLRKIGVDHQYRMRPEELESAILQDRENGWLPFCVTATVGTTSTTSIDPVPAIAEICARHRLWLHVDAAYAGPAAIAPEFSWVMEGCQKADSIVTNPHKWLFTPIDLSVFYCRRPEVLREAFSLVPDYLHSEEEATNFMDYGIQLGRRFRALKLWMVLRYFGRRGVESRIRQHCRWGREFADWVEAESRLELMAPVPFSTICFRAVPQQLEGDEEALDAFNEQLVRAVNATGRAFLSHTRLKGRIAIRMTIGNLKTRSEHIDRAKEILRREAARLSEDLDRKSAKS